MFFFQNRTVIFLNQTEVVLLSIYWLEHDCKYIYLMEKKKNRCSREYGARVECQYDVVKMWNLWYHGR